jgi:hypothetical protein
MAVLLLLFAATACSNPRPWTVQKPPWNAAMFEACEEARVQLADGSRTRLREVRAQQSLRSGFLYGSTVAAEGRPSEPRKYAFEDIVALETCKPRNLGRLSGEREDTAPGMNGVVLATVFVVVLVLPALLLFAL